MPPAVEASFHRHVPPSAGQCHPSPTYTVLPPETSPKGRMLSQLAGYSLTVAPTACYILTTVAQGEYRGLSQGLEVR